MRKAGIGERTPKAVQRMRDRYGRWNHDRPFLCWKCGMRHVMTDNAQARKWGLCPECYAEELRLRERDRQRNDALRQRRMRTRKRKRDKTNTMS